MAIDKNQPKQITISGLSLPKDSEIEIISYAEFQEFEASLHVSHWRENRSTLHQYLDTPEKYVAPQLPALENISSARTESPEMPRRSTGTSRGAGITSTPPQMTPLPLRMRAAGPASTLGPKPSPSSQSLNSQASPQNSQSSQWPSPWSQLTQNTDYSDF